MRSEERERKNRERMQLMRRIDPTTDPREAAAAFEERRKKRMLILLAGTILLAASAVLVPGSGLLGAGGELLRHAAGGGSYAVSLIAAIGEKEIETEVEVSEQVLSEEESAALFEAASEELQTRMLGNNESADYVIYDLDLPAETADGMVEAAWSFDSYQILGSDGSICGEIPEEGTLVEVTLTMTCQERTAESVFTICIYPAPVSEDEALEQALADALTQADESTATEESLVLPTEVDGTSVSWSEQQEHYGLKILLIGILVIVILQYEDEEKLKREAQKRDVQMLEDYAGIVNKLSLLLGAGMTVYGAWEQVTGAYVREQQEQAKASRQRKLHIGPVPAVQKRIAYEEMKITCIKIREGEGETKAYEAFGRRCGLRPYLKLSAILTQNLKLGTAGVTAQLAAEARDAFEQRKAQARKKGEEAGTKLMLPMMMMLGVVLAMIMIPGFMSM